MKKMLLWAILAMPLWASEKTNLIHRSVSAIDPNHVVVATTNYFGDGYIACREKDKGTNGRVFIYCSSSITSVRPLPRSPKKPDLMKFMVKKGRDNRKIALQAGEYEWLWLDSETMKKVFVSMSK